MPFDHLTQRPLAVPRLAEALRSGTLTLFLGTGRAEGALPLAGSGP